jgi:hypothetical protein
LDATAGERAAVSANFLDRAFTASAPYRYDAVRLCLLAAGVALNNVARSKSFRVTRRRKTLT